MDEYVGLQLNILHWELVNRSYGHEAWDKLPRSIRASPGYEHEVGASRTKQKKGVGESSVLLQFYYLLGTISYHARTLYVSYTPSV
ncbi:hypothetical protein VTI28DRAFT_8390 [Corynascus sepedonium]